MRSAYPSHPLAKVLMSPRLPSIALVLAAAISFLYPPAATAEDASDPVFEAGQEWSIESGSGAKIVVGHVEDWRNEKAIHVSIVDIPVPPGLPRAGTVTQIAYAPFAYAALQGSVVKLLRTNVPPSSDFEAGYKQWQDAHGGVFTVSAAEAIELMFKSLYGN
jgi:hypothetical protein